jgi:uncharacterized protein YqjF (DUF2071 family)
LKHPAEAATASGIKPQPIVRSAPQPVERVAMLQTWRRLTFLHWPYDPAVVLPLIPAGLKLDTFQGAAYVGLIPFEIHNLFGIPHFPETNVRTYVIGPDGSRAVWFFSLDAGRLLAVIGARAGYGLPYFWANMHVKRDHDKVRYDSRRKWPHTRSHFTGITVHAGEQRDITELDDFFTARYRLYTLLRGRLGFAQIEHDPWPLASATVQSLDQNLIEAAGLPSPQGAPLCHFVEKIDVKIGHARLC